MNKKRIDWVDVAKGIAMILVIVVHAEEHFMPDTIGNLTRTDQREYGRSIVDFYTYSR